ncbi:hypothetical protein [Stenotrophomonas forensis]|uniref:hypothetical protein n=1 Tax=Stenotrophomonas forensis TaxID=2871169 RepID=UPI0039C68FF7
MNRELYVQLTQEELQSPNYRSMEIVARALLVELRALESLTGSARVSLSVREARTRLNVTQRPVERAFRALLLHGWIEETKTEAGQRRVVLLKSPVPASTETVGEADE